jgi:hypothetical protein
MRSRPNAIGGKVVVATLAAGALTVAHAQTPARGGRSAAPTTQPSASARRPDANLLQVMRGIVYPSSNVVFAGQDDISALPKSDNPAMSPNLLTSTYGGWTAVENASLALTEPANLILMAGRLCSNGKPAPVQRADWVRFSQGLRDAGLAAYKAAQSKSMDAMVDASGAVADACQACHEVYREKPNVVDRCTP